MTWWAWMRAVAWAMLERVWGDASARAGGSLVAQTSGVGDTDVPDVDEVAITVSTFERAPYTSRAVMRDKPTGKTLGVWLRAEDARLMAALCQRKRMGRVWAENVVGDGYLLVTVTQGGDEP